MNESAQYLYLTTTGRLTGQEREIEIWFIEHDQRFYLMAEHRERAQWVRNIQVHPVVTIRVGERRLEGTARVIRDHDDPKLTSAVNALFDAKYGWSDGLVVQLEASKA